MIRTIIASAALLALAPVAGSAQQSIDGTYTDQDGYTEIRVARCGNARCGTITKILRTKPGETNRDRHNDNPDLRNRTITGIKVLQNLRWDDGVWRGRVYNPEDGGTYRAEVRPGRNGTLEVKGCVTLFCRTVNWPSR